MTTYNLIYKELDAETGLYYYGARYHAYRQAGYTPEIGIWLSVDPLSDKYPSMSAYMYCARNLVILVDPDGREIKGFSFDNKGNIQIDKKIGKKKFRQKHEKQRTAKF